MKKKALSPGTCPQILPVSRGKNLAESTLRGSSLKKLLVILLLLLSNCAYGTIEKDGSLHGIAFGHSKIEDCRRKNDFERPDCRRIQGGNLSTGAAEFLSNLLTGIGAWFGVAG